MGRFDPCVAWADPDQSETRMTRFPDLYVLRHGETEWNREGIFQGVHDSPLTAMGREQAAHQGKILDRVISDWSKVDIYSSCLLYTSPSPRDKRQSRMPSSA